MATLAFPYDHSKDPMSPVQLAAQIQTALTLASPPAVDINQTEIIVTRAGVTESNRATIQGLINSYVYDPVAAALPPGNEGVIKSRALNALTANATFLALASPTNAEVLAQVRRLTRQMDGLIRLELHALEDILDT